MPSRSPAVSSSRSPATTPTRNKSRPHAESAGPVPTALAETAGDVILGGLLGRIREYLLGVVDLDQPARLARRLQVEERRLVAHPGGLLHVVGHDDDCVVLLQLGDQVLDRQRGNGVQRRT